MTGVRTLYRGLKLSLDQIESYVVGESVNLTGYVSSSPKKKIAMGFSLDGATDKNLAVLFEIEFTGEKGLFELTEGFTAYPDEAEVLIQDGLKYRVIENSQ